MRDLPYLVVSCVLLSGAFFGMLAYPDLEAAVQERIPLLAAHDVSRQLHAEVAAAATCHDSLPPCYGTILADYGRLPQNGELLKLQALSACTRKPTLLETPMTALILWKRNLPRDFLCVDPVRDIVDTLAEVRRQEGLMAAQREKLIAEHALTCLKYDPPPPPSVLPAGRRPLPESVLQGFFFCSERIPLERADVRLRVEHQIEYLMTDFRETTGIWLKRRDRYAGVILNLLLKEGVPREFVLLPALESGYDRSQISPSMAGGWWQFVKPTAIGGQAGDKELDWTLHANDWKDERMDLVVATRSAARYLKWLRSKTADARNGGSWITAAAAYNAGLTEIRYRIGAYNTASYWDMKLPLETEEYVPRWIALSIIDSHRAFYGLEVPEIAPMQFDTLEDVVLTHDLPLTVLASLTESSVRFIREINGGLKRGVSSFPARRNEREIIHTIHVPGGCKDDVLKSLRQLDYLKQGT